MVLLEADNLITPHLKHPDFQIFLNYNPNLQELLKKIREGVKKIDTPENFHLITGLKFVEVDQETENNFLEFARICKENLKTKSDS